MDEAFAKNLCVRFVILSSTLNNVIYETCPDE